MTSTMAAIVNSGLIRYRTCGSHPRSGRSSTAETVACRPLSDLLMRNCCLIAWMVPTSKVTVCPGRAIFWRYFIVAALLMRKVVCLGIPVSPTPSPSLVTPIPAPGPVPASTMAVALDADQLVSSSAACW